MISGNDRIYVGFYVAVRASECVFRRHRSRRRHCCSCCCYFFYSLSLVRSTERNPLNKLSDVVFGVFILSIRPALPHTHYSIAHTCTTGTVAFQMYRTLFIQILTDVTLHSLFVF